jgi:hypothetical protein
MSKRSLKLFGTLFHFKTLENNNKETEGINLNYANQYLVASTSEYSPVTAEAIYIDRDHLKITSNTDTTDHSLIKH